MNAAEILRVCETLLRGTNARSVVLVDRDGGEIARAEEERVLDAGTLSSLLAGEIAASEGVASLLAERVVSSGQMSFHVSVIAGRAVLVVAFDVRSSLGLVRLRVKKAVEDLSRLLEPGSGGSGDGGLPSGRTGKSWIN